jgi:hypothetical protein
MNHSAVTWQTFAGDDLRYWVRVESEIFDPGLGAARSKGP